MRKPTFDKEPRLAILTMLSDSDTTQLFGVSDPRAAARSHSNRVCFTFFYWYITRMGVAPRDVYVAYISQAGKVSGSFVNCLRTANVTVVHERRNMSAEWHPVIGTRISLCTIV